MGAALYLGAPPQFPCYGHYSSIELVAFVHRSLVLKKTKTHFQLRMSGLREDEERPLVARVAVAPNENTPVPATRHSAVCLRFTLLLCVCIIIFSGYFSYDLPSITSAQLKEHPFDLTNTQLGLLFTVYALPNTILPLFSGTFYTRLGVWRGIIAIGTTIAVGIIVIAIGVGADSFSLMMLGRAIYGIGGESLYVGVDVLTTTWFKVGASVHASACALALLK